MRPSSSRPEPAHSKQPWPLTPASARPRIRILWRGGVRQTIIVSIQVGTPQSVLEEIPKPKTHLALFLVDVIIVRNASIRQPAEEILRQVSFGRWWCVRTSRNRHDGGDILGQCTRSSDHRARRSVYAMSGRYAVAGESIFDNFVSKPND